MSNLEIKRDHTGTLHLFVAGHPALGAKVAAMQHIDGIGLCATVFVPIKEARFGEVSSVIAFQKT